MFQNANNIVVTIVISVIYMLYIFMYIYYIFMYRSLSLHFPMLVMFVKPT